MANRIQLRRGGAQEWANANPTLAQGEFGVELDTGRIKIGDGVTPWNSLRYERPIESTSNTANTLVQRDADGNFAAGTITATLIGNSSTAARLASQRQISLAQDIQASGVFDGSQNLTLNAVLQLVTTLPHYDGTDTSSGTYTKVVVDAKGRITSGSIPTTIQDYGLDGTTEGSSAQPYNNELSSISNLGTTGFISRIASGTVTTREIEGNAGRISVDNGRGISANPSIDLINTTVVDGNYNTESLTSVSAAGPNSEPFGTETVNAVKFTVDQWGRLTSATNVPIATATEGSKYATYSAGAAYSRYDIIEEGGNVYQAIQDILAGAGAPAHTDSSDTGGWRFLAAAATEQKGLASFAQEDFDVDSNGHVTISAAGVDNTQLQNNRIIFTDQNTVQEFELDNELTTSTAHTGFDYLNYIKVNNTNGNLLFGANNTGDGGAGEVDINVRTYFSDPDIMLDGLLDQTISKVATGNLNITSVQNDGVGKEFNIGITNTGAGSSTLNLTAEDVVSIQATESTGKVHVEDARFQSNYIATTNATLNLDPGDDRAVTGLVRIWGDLQVDGTTTTVNSTTLQVDDVVITLGGDTAPVADDNLDRGIEFRYYDTAAKIGFYGYDDSYTDLAGHVGGFRFLYDATNTSEVFSGTDAGLIGGNLRLTTGTNSTSNTTGDLAVAGGVGITQDVNIGGLVDIDSTLRVHSTSRFDDSMVIQGASKTLQLNNGSGTTRIELQSTTGNADFYGIVNITNDLNINTNKFNVASATGNTLIAGTLGVTGATTLTGALDLNNTLNVSGFTYLEDTDVPTVALNQTTGFYEIQSSDYGAFRFDGGGYVAGTTVFNDHVYVNGQILQREDTTANYNRQNYLEVRYKLRTGTRAAYTPSYATDDTSNLRVYGGAGIATDLHVGDDFYIGKVNSSDTIEFQVLGENGNTTIGRSGAGTASVGTLTVHGDVTFNRDLFANGNITLGNATSDTLTVQANSEFNGTVDVDADFAVRSGTTDKFFVDNVTGNTDIQGTLDVNGATQITNTLNVTNGVDFDQTLNVDGAVDFNSTLVVDGQTTIYDSLILQSNNEILSIRNGSAVEKFSVDFDNGNTNIIGTLTVGDATQINDTFGASGIVTLTNNTDQTLTGLYAADGAVRMTGGLGVQRNLAVGGNMRVYGDFEISGSTTQSGNTGFSGRVTITNTSDITSYTDNTVALSTEGGFRAEKNAYIGGDFYVWDPVNSRASFFVDNSTGDATLHNTLTVGGDLVVNGTTTTINSTVTTLDDPIITLGGDTAPTSNDAKDRGVEFRYYDGSAKVGFFGFDRSAQQFAFLTSATNTSEVLAGTDGALRAGSLNLTGSGTALDVDANANIDGTLTVDGQIISQVTSGPALVIPNTTKINNLNADLLDSMTTASAATPTTVVNRDSNGDFAANQITVNNGIGALAGIQGNATTADALRTARTITIDGVVDGSVSFDGSANVTISTVYNDADITALAAMAGTGFVSRTAANTYAQRTLQVTASSGITLTNADGVAGNPTINVASASTNASNNLVLRDGSGNFAANVITADLVGDVTGQVSSIANHDTGDLAEGTNLYFTNERVDDRVAALISAGTGISATYNDAGNILSLSAVPADFDTDDIAEGSTNLYYTAGRAEASFDGKMALATTTDLAEGTNLYFTNARADARADARIAAATTDDLTEGVANLYYTDARADARVAAATGVNLDLTNQTTTDLTEGTNLYFTNTRADARIAAASVTDLTDVDQALATTDDVVFNSVEANLRATGTAPTTATDPGTAGDIRYDANYIYICVAANTWQRAAHATW
ncbi:outer membrane protein [Synechococcus phage S-B64]|uniref:Outer membrane protein n=2 Tax=Shandvirus TaxID=2948904 RepID=A0A1Z1LWN5_9CAUD|nr:structural protein [Synechococcus phage S-H35]YP_010095245.1 structural protein [Synechococcus phage S-B64]ARW57078.1 outer membrane protein [Synechococcus phage S-H35]AWD90043.1 outer membrane protein [Synechococcus phage S-B64]